MIRESVRAVARALGVLAVTAAEVTALSVWLGLVTDASTVSLASLLGVVALAGGLLVSALVTWVTVNGRRGPVPGPTVLGLSAVETVVWLGWLGTVTWLAGLDRLADPLGVTLASLVLAATLTVRLTVADNVLRGRPVHASLVTRTTAGLGVLEAAGATAWLLVVTGQVPVPWFLAVEVAGFSPAATFGAALLAVTLFVQHLFAVRFALRATTPPAGSDVPTSWSTPRK